MRVQVKQERPLSPSTLKLHSLAALQVAQQMQSAQVTAHSLPGESTVTISLDPAEGASVPLGTAAPDTRLLKAGVTLSLLGHV